MNNPASRRFVDQVAVVTGSGRGIGKAEAFLLAAHGATVVVSDLGIDDGVSRAETTVAEIQANGGTAVAYTSDLSSFEGASGLIDLATKEFGRIDILINNAGLRAANAISDISESDYDLVVDSHLKATFGTIKYAAEVFERQRSGSIVNTGSEAGFGHPFNSAYAAAKEAIAGLTRTVAREFARFNVRCNLLRPRADTFLGVEYDEPMKRWAPEIRQLGAYRVGMRGLINSDVRPSTPEQVAQFVVWLCSDAANNFNGAEFFVQGIEIGLWDSPNLAQSAFSPNGWDLDSLDEFMPATLALGQEDVYRKCFESPIVS